LAVLRVLRQHRKDDRVYDHAAARADAVSLVTVSGRFWSIYLACLVDLFGRSACIAPTAHND
jgi:hypothetical protein